MPRPRLVRRSHGDGGGAQVSTARWRNRGLKAGAATLPGAFQRSLLLEINETKQLWRHKSLSAAMPELV